MQQTEVAGHVISFAVEELMLKGVELRFKANIQGNKSECVAKSMPVVQRHVSAREGSIPLFPCFCFANEMIFLQLVPFPSFPDSSPKTGR